MAAVVVSVSVPDVELYVIVCSTGVRLAALALLAVLPYWLTKIRLAPLLPAWTGVTPEPTHAECSSFSMSSSAIRECWDASTVLNVRVV